MAQQWTAQQPAWQQGQQQQWGQAQGGVNKDCTLVVTGCTHGTVGPIVRGVFQLVGENHGKPAYKKDGQVNGLDVMTYYWDERDGPGFCGWWFGPKIGGDQVWAYHADRNSTMPPQTGWKVPYDGDIDHSFAIAFRPKGSVAPPAPPPQQQQWGQQQQQWQPQQQQQWGQQQQQQQQWGQQKDPMQQQMEAQQQAQRRAEEQKKKDEEMAAKKVEQQAVLTIRRVMQTFRASTEDKFDENKQAMDQVVATEIEKCGSQKERLMTEVTQAEEQTRKRLAQLEENKIKQKEMKAKAEELLTELEKLIETAETAAKSTTEEADPLIGEEKGDIKLEVIEACAEAVEAAGKEATAALKLCTDFIDKEGAKIKGVQTIPGEPVPTCGADLNKLVGRVTEARKSNSNTVSKVHISKNTKTKKFHAQGKRDKALAVFKKFDADKDNKLSRKEIQAMSKAEFNFVPPAETLDCIVSHLVDDGAKGVEKENFFRMKIMLGIGREMAIDGKRKAAREAKEKELADIKEKLVEKVKAVADQVTSAGESCTKTDEQVKTLNFGEAKDKNADEMFSLLDATDKAIEEAKDALAKSREEITALSTDEAQLKGFLASEIKKLGDRVKPLEEKNGKHSTTAAKYRENAVKKAAAELDKLREQALAMIFHHQGEKGLSKDDLYKAFDAKDTGKIQEAAFAKFFKSCEVQEDTERMAESDVTRLFKKVAGESGVLSKDAFKTLTQKFMKVVKASVITEESSIKSTPIRRLAEGEVLEVLTGLTKDADDATISRLKVKAMTDDKEGWVTPLGTQGTVYLKDGGNVFKVVKETILTGSFVIGENTTVKDRKLKVGEVLEVCEWEKKEEATGLKRMKVRVKSDGQEGFVTTLGNTGIKFVEAI